MNEDQRTCSNCGQMELRNIDETVTCNRMSKLSVGETCWHPIGVVLIIEEKDEDA